MIPLLRLDKLRRAAGLPAFPEHGEAPRRIAARCMIRTAHAERYLERLRSELERTCQVAEADEWLRVTMTTGTSPDRETLDMRSEQGALVCEARSDTARGLDALKGLFAVGLDVAGLEEASNRIRWIEL